MTTLTKMIYICSPYSGKSKYKFVNYFIRLFRFRKITKIIGQLQDLYPYAFIGPITQSHLTAKYMKNQGTSFKSWELRDLTYIHHCNEVWVIMLPGWDESKGILEELNYSIKHCIKVKHIDPNNLFTLMERSISVRGDICHT